jgi:hypothetical protein
MRIFYNTGFTQIPNYILRSKVLKPSQKVVLAVLCSYANDENVAFPSYQTIANDSGISRRKAIEIVKAMGVQRGLLHMQQSLSKTYFKLTISTLQYWIKQFEDKSCM